MITTARLPERYPLQDAAARINHRKNKRKGVKALPDDEDNQQPADDQSSTQSISFAVEGDVPAIAQPKSMACWATVTTMNMSWKNQQSYSIEAETDSLGSDFQIFLQRKPNFPKE